jgi:hypothetical protein
MKKRLTAVTVSQSGRGVSGALRPGLPLRVLPRSPRAGASAMVAAQTS